MEISMDEDEEFNETSTKKRICLPSEVWTDIFSLLSRRVLTSHVQPVCKAFHFVAERYVPSVYTFRNFSHLLTRLSGNLLSEAEEEEDSDDHGSDVHTDLARHYRLGPLACTSLSKHWTVSYQCRLHVLEMFSNCPALFRDCHLKLRSDVLTMYMEHIQHVRPSYISLGFDFNSQADKIFKNPIILQCSHLKLYGDVWKEDTVEPAVNGICHWLHHLSTDKNAEKMRLLYFGYHSSIIISAIVENCKKLLQHTTTVLERRAFIFIFVKNDFADEDKLTPFQIINKNSGEVLQFERHSYKLSTYRSIYTLCRYVKTDLINEDQFYREIIEQIGVFGEEPKKWGCELPIVDLNYQ